jgi:hypothetical protein
MLQPGELIYVSMQPQARTDRPEREDARVVPVIVRRGERGTASVRLVQNFGGPDDPPATPLRVKRGRGRPPRPPDQKTYVIRTCPG